MSTLTLFSSVEKMNRMPRDEGLFFDRGAWDTLHERHPSTGEPLFTYRVFRGDQEVGSAVFYKHPLLCRSEKGDRHNILSLHGVLANYDVDGQLHTVEDVCAALPPTVVEQWGKAVLHGAQHGVVRGIATVVSHACDRQGVRQSTAQYINHAVYYTGMFAVHYCRRYQALDEVRDVSYGAKAMEAVYQAAWDTGALLLTQVAIEQGCRSLRWLGQKAEQTGWKTMANVCRWLGSNGVYGTYAYQVYQQDPSQLAVSVATGMITERAVIAGGQQLVDTASPAFFKPPGKTFDSAVTLSENRDNVLIP